MADKVAEFYHLAGLREKLSVLKAIRMEVDRLRNERSQRRDWRSASGPVPSALNVYIGTESSSHRLLQNGGPAPSMHRPRLASAKPSTEPSPFSRKPVTAQYNDIPSSRAYDEDSPPPEKRKRDSVEENTDNEEESAQGSFEVNPKRQAMDTFSRDNDQTKSGFSFFSSKDTRINILSGTQNQTHLLRSLR